MWTCVRLKSRHIHLLRRQIGIVFQDFQLLTDRSVHENLLLYSEPQAGVTKMRLPNV